MKPTASARLPSRAKLASAIERHADAKAQLDRIEQAIQKLYDDNITSRTRIAAARDALAIARAGRSEIIIAKALGEPGPDLPDPVEAERVLAECERELDDARKARAILEAEAARAKSALGLADRALSRAVEEVVASDRALTLLRDEFERCRRRMSRLIGALSGAGVPVSRVAWDERAFIADPTWAAAISRLREDPDAPLPGIPPEDGPDAGARDGRKAAA